MCLAIELPRHLLTIYGKTPLTKLEDLSQDIVDTLIGYLANTDMWMIDLMNRNGNQNIISKVLTNLNKWIEK